MASTGRWTRSLAISRVHPAPRLDPHDACPWIPGFTLQNAKGMTTEWFERMLTAYVDAALDPDVTLTPKQRETARRCQILQRGLIRTGLDALVDERCGDDLMLRP